MEMKEIILNFLRQKNISQKNFAASIEVTPQAVSKWITGSARPKQENIERIDEVYGVNFDDERKKDINLSRQAKIEDLDSVEKYINESHRILDECEINANYSHSVYVLTEWLLTAVIGLTEFRCRKSPSEYEDYDWIFYNLAEFFEKDNCTEYSRYKSCLDEAFYLMGDDLFESFDENGYYSYVERGNSAIRYWEQFSQTVEKIKNSSVYADTIIAIHEIIDKGLQLC